MKIAALHLLAFGPFTDRSVTLEGGTANLHLVYGPNEAGKSSALRAMSELRFGIQMRSADNFVHPYERMQIGGSFIDAAGERVELLRTKGRSKTLFYIDPATRLADKDRDVAGDHHAALTGGLSRTDFAAMFGLNHERLREGGKQLLRGDGELGSALFEASAGTRGTAALLEALDDDARQLFNPRGNAKNAVLNEASKQFEDARRSYREALVKPADWQQRKRAHDEARAALAALQEAIERERRSMAESSELRIVEPLLRQLDAAAAEVRSLADVPDLPESAKQERMAAEPALLRAEQDAAAAQELVERCSSALAGLEVDDALIRHAPAIERFVIDVEAGARSRAEAVKLQAAIDRIAVELEAGARRIAGKGASAADVLAALPSQAEQRALADHFKAIDDLLVETRMRRQQASDAADQLALAAEHRSESAPDPSLRAAVLEALSRAHALGDVEQRLRDTDRQRRDLSMQLAQTISDLEMTVVLMETLDRAHDPAHDDAHERDRLDDGNETRTMAEASMSSSVPSSLPGAMTAAPRPDDLPAKLRAYRTAKPLLSAEIEAVRLANSVRDELHRKVTLDMEALQRDIDAQRRRLVELSAAGEVVTSDMLKETRSKRDAMWARIRGTYLGESPDMHAGEGIDPVPPATLAVGFEAAQGAADRQADLLRADAERAAIFEECRTRIEQMLERQGELARLESRLSVEERMGVQTWTQQLRLAGLPVGLRPSALHEWQTLRAGLLDKADRLGGLHADRDVIMASISTAVHALSDALEGISSDVAAEMQRPMGSMGTPVVVASDIAMLATLMRRAIAWEDLAVKQAAAHEARTAALAEQRQALQRGRTAITQAEAELKTHRDATLAWLERAFLAADATPALCRARLSELTELQALASEAATQAQRRQEQAAIGEELLAQAAHVAALVGDPAPAAAALRDYADAIGERLRTNLEAGRQRDQFKRDLARGEADRRSALAALARGRQTLQQLCTAAGVQDAAALPAVEDAAARKRRAEQDERARRALLAQASARSLEALRERIGGQDSIALDSSIERCKHRIAEIESQLVAAAQAEQAARVALEAIDSSDQAAQWRERMEQAGARYRAAVLPWARLKLAHALLQESLKRFRDRAQAPMVQAASRYFSTMTGGLYARLIVTDDGDKPVLQAERASEKGGGRIAIEAMSEGTGDQLYLALRLAALELRRASHPDMPLVLDDVLITSDDARAANILKALAEFSKGTQVLVFTHHQHVLDVARATLAEDRLAIHGL